FPCRLRGATECRHPDRVNMTKPARANRTIGSPLTRFPSPGAPLRTGRRFVGMTRTPSIRADSLVALTAGIMPPAATSAQAVFTGIGSFDPAIRDAIIRFGRPALAWEIRRRDPLYRAAVDQERSAQGLNAASG